MIHIHCDRCKADIDPEGKIGKMSWGFKNGIEGMVSSDLLYGKVYCERCMDLCMAFIQGHTEPSRGQIKADKRGKPRLQCGDQIVRLSKDGMTTKQIAEKLGLNQKQVQNYLYHHKDE